MVGEIIQNLNGTQYVVLAQIGEDRALLHGGHDYVVINDLQYFREKRSWGGGTYFPCFNDNECSCDALRRALYFLQYRVYLEVDDE